MKDIYMIRHAKSDWSNGVSDFERGLNKRGLIDAPLMGEVLKQKSILPDLLLSSPALRAKLTAEKIAKKIGYKEEKIVYENSLYLADVRGFYHVIDNLHDNINSVMIVSHNNGITDFVNSLSKENIYNMPTCSIAHIRVSVDSWSYISAGGGELIFFDFPKNHKL